MLLGIKTDGPTVTFVLYDASGTLLDRHDWLAERALARYLLKELETFLEKNGATFEMLNGLFVFEGPGSFTGLRIGMSVMNTLAYGLQIPIIPAGGEKWDADAAARLVAGERGEVVLPVYGAEARITKQKK